MTEALWPDHLPQDYITRLTGMSRDKFLAQYEGTWEPTTERAVAEDRKRQCKNKNCMKWTVESDFYSDSSKAAGLNRWCKACSDQKKNNLREKDKTRIKPIKVNDPTGKVCEECGVWKKKVEFRVSVDRTDRMKPECADCNKKYLRVVFTNLIKSKKQRCKDKGIPFHVTIHDLKNIWTGHCLCCNLPLVFRAGSNSEETPNLDKILVEKGYVSGNIQWLCGRCNRIQNNGEGLLHLKLVYMRAKHVGVKPEFLAMLESEACPLFAPDYADEPESMLYPVPADPYLPDGTLRPESETELEEELTRRLGSH